MTTQNLTPARIPWAMTTAEYRLSLLARLRRERKDFAGMILAMTIRNAAGMAGGCQG